MSPPPPFRCAGVLSFFTGNTCMNPSDAIEAIEKPLSSLPY
ncbi:GTPase family protein, partial [Escherichia coli]|nr:GTPase family protein [Escherichia coli]MDN1255439.1 GTPase family protein [Escherichia coli]MDN1273941.1 GTPase family protein [Escherichia coli]MDN1573475.1 GTPase family protein [Escherichia coli]MDN1862468.1 GTPase family protein [Escherichia coli]